MDELNNVELAIIAERISYSAEAILSLKGNIETSVVEVADIILSIKGKGKVVVT